MEEVHILVEVHSKDPPDYGSWREAAGNDRNNFHHLVQLQVHIAYVKVLHVDHDITIVLAEVVGLYDVIVNVAEIFYSSFIQQVTFTFDKAVDEIPYRRKISF